MNKHKKGTMTEEAGKAEIKRKQPEGRPQPKKTKITKAKKNLYQN